MQKQVGNIARAVLRAYLAIMSTGARQTSGAQSAAAVASGIRRGWSRDALQTRVAALGVLLLAIFCFSIAACLTPSVSGYGTHRQLGYPACLMPMLTGHPCPTCGMTTAFAYAIRGRLIRSFHAQPAGFALAIAFFAAALCSVRAVITGRYAFMALRIQPGWLALWVLIVVLFGWFYKWITFSP